MSTTVAVLLASQLFIHDVPIECINRVAEQYQVPAKMIISVLNTEGGRNGLEHKNDNGSMQINSIWLPELDKYGIHAEELRDDPCTNVEVGTWILSQAIADGILHDKSYLESVAGYHSKTTHYNQLYQQRVFEQYSHLEQVLTKA
jgi:hypothetical protein